MPTYTLPLTHRPTREGDVLTFAHVPFYLALEINSDAWAIALNTACDGILTPRDMAVVHVTSDFRREMFVGVAEFDVQLKAIGVSSLMWVVEISQDGLSAGTVTTVLSRVDESRLHSIPLSAPQRAALEPLLNG